MAEHSDCNLNVQQFLTSTSDWNLALQIQDHVLWKRGLLKVRTVKWCSYRFQMRTLLFSDSKLKCQCYPFWDKRWNFEMRFELWNASKFEQWFAFQVALWNFSQFWHRPTKECVFRWCCVCSIAKFSNIWFFTLQPTKFMTFQSDALLKVQNAIWNSKNQGLATNFTSNWDLKLHQCSNLKSDRIWKP